MRALPGALLALLLASGVARAQSVASGDVTVHYAAVPSTALDRDVARGLGVVPSPQRVLLTVAVRRGATGREQSLEADVQARVRDPSGTAVPVRMRAVREAGTVSYVGEARLAATGPLRFEIEVRVPDRAAPIRAAFAQEFFLP
jgi:hypothetical protein